jgi:autotransporter-associated beta strand protein
MGITLGSSGGTIQSGYGSGYTFTVNGAISGSGRLTKSDSGNLLLLSDNTYSGGTNLSGGVLQLGNGGTAGTLGSGAVSMSNDATLAITRSDNFTVPNDISGWGYLRNYGSGTTTLTGNNTYRDNTIVTGGGTLVVTTVVDAGGIGSIGNLYANWWSWLGVRGNSTLRITGLGSQVTSRRIWNDASLVAPDLIGGSTFDIVNPTTTVTFTDSGGAITRTLNKAGLGKLSLAQAISSSAGVSVTGGMLTLGGTNSYSGTTSISTGAFLEYSATSNQSLAGAFVGSGHLLKSGAGVLTLSSASSSFSGNVEVSGGELILADKSPLRFLVTDGGSNQIRGVGNATLKGRFVIDTSSVTSLNATWSLVNTSTLTESFTSTFSIQGQGWLESANIWTLADGAKTWTFNEATGILAVTSSLTPYQTWANSHGLVESNAAFGADPDQDGIANGLEFVLGGEPNPDNPDSNSSEILPRLSISNGKLIFSFKRKNLSEGNVQLVFQWSSDLNFHGTTRDILIGSFDSLTDDVTVDVLENSPDNETDSIVISLPLDKTTTGKIFGRLKVFEN